MHTFHIELWKKIFNLFTEEGYGGIRIAKYLNKRGYKTHKYICTYYRSKYRKQILTDIKWEIYSNKVILGDFNTSLPFFTSYGWTPKSFNVISEQAKNNGTALSTVPTSNHFDHIFGTGNYTVKRYEFFNNVNQHSALSDHPFVYADLAF